MGTEAFYEVAARCRFSHILTKKPKTKWYDQDHNYWVIAKSQPEAKKVVTEEIEKALSPKLKKKKKFSDCFIEIDFTTIKKAEPVENPASYNIPDRLVAYDKDGESSITDLKNAVAERDNRHKEFNRSKLNDRDFDRYIDSIVKEISLRLGAIKRNIFEIGRLLNDAKSLIDYDDFKQWVKDELKMSARTAENYIKVYEHCMYTPELVNYFKPSILYKVCSKSFPQDLRQELFSNATGDYDFKYKDFLAVVSKFKNGEIDLESDEVKALLNKKRDCVVNNRLIAELEGTRRDMKKRLAVLKKLYWMDFSSPVEISSDDSWVDFYENIEKKFDDFLKTLRDDISKLRV
ncbi:DUF3102 domain-containing protein [Thermodesulfobacteriota bacterium]